MNPTPDRHRSFARFLAPAVALALLATACGYEGPQSLPLPGGKGGGGYEVVVVLEDATNLVAHETCRAGDVIIGSVESVELDQDLNARVVCRIENDVTLPANVTATLRETSLLGERYVALDPPRGEAPSGTLAAGTEIAPSRTTAQPDTEMVLGALSLVLNGGSLSSIASISQELNEALARPGDVRTTTRRLADLMATLDGRRTSLVTALDALGRLTETLATQRGVIAEALEAVPGGLAALDRQRPALVDTLGRLSRLSRTAVPLIQQSKAATIKDLQHLQPVLAQLDTAKSQLSRTLERLASFPFSRNALSTIKGDYAGMYGQALIDVDTINALLTSLADLAPGGDEAAVAAPEASGPAEGPDTVRELLEGLDLTSLLGAPLAGLGNSLDLSGLLTPGGNGGTASDTTPPSGLGGLLTGGAR